MRVVLVSTYELGHQPLHVASPAAALRSAGHEVRCLDLAVERWDPQWLEWGEAVAFSVPMHTAMRLALRAAEALRSQRPELPLCLYGLYAPVSRDLTVGRLVDRVIAGEYEPALVAWVGGLTRAERSDSPGAEVVHLGRERFELPARELLPPLERYARLVLGDEERLVGYVEASHGCVHRCRHCPVPAVYDGRIRIVHEDVLLRDVELLVEMGARHLTFGDPDFLNGVKHSLSVVRAVHERFPELSFDCTTKVEHVLEHAPVWPELAESGCLFVVSALECVNDAILVRLDKGHTTADASPTGSPWPPPSPGPAGRRSQRPGWSGRTTSSIPAASRSARGSASRGSAARSPPRTSSLRWRGRSSQIAPRRSTRNLWGA